MASIPWLTVSYYDKKWFVILQGKEPLPNLAVGSERGTGFTREKAKPLYVHRNPNDVSNKAINILFLII